MQAQLDTVRSENKSLDLVLAKEAELAKEKEKLEARALSVLSDDLHDQLSEMEETAKAVTGKVTPYGFEQTLQESMRETIRLYE